MRRRTACALRLRRRAWPGACGWLMGALTAMMHSSMTLAALLGQHNLACFAFQAATFELTPLPSPTQASPTANTSRGSRRVAVAACHSTAAAQIGTRTGGAALLLLLAAAVAAATVCP